MRSLSRRPVRALALALLLALGAAARADEPVYDVIVVGGGPGGMVAAAKLAAHGRRVLVIEKRSAVRARPQIVGVKDVAADTLHDVGVELRDDERARYLPAWGSESHPYPPAPDAVRDPVAHMARMMGTHTLAINELERRLYAQGSASPQIDVVPLTAPTSAPRLDDDGETVRMSIATLGSPAREVKGRYLVLADGAGAETAQALGAKTKVYARAKLAAAFFKRTGRHLIVGGDGAGRLGDGASTYTLTAITAGVEALGKAAVDARVRELSRSVGAPGEPRRVWTFDTVMQRPDKVLLLGGRALIVGDASGTPHPFTAMGVNKAIVEGADAADTISRLLDTPDPAARAIVAARWVTRTMQGVGAVHAAGLPYYEKFGTVTKRPIHAERAARRIERDLAKARPPAPRPGRPNLPP